jgi:hypothetical protein
MRKIMPFLLLITLCSCASLVEATECWTDSIMSVSSNGSILIMLSGSIYKVDELDRLDSELWLAADDVLVCDDGRIINKDEDGEVVGAQRLR